MERRTHRGGSQERAKSHRVEVPVAGDEPKEHTTGWRRLVLPLWQARVLIQGKRLRIAFMRSGREDDEIFVEETNG
jgi:hypothetical protein